MDVCILSTQHIDQNKCKVSIMLMNVKCGGESDIIRGISGSDKGYDLLYVFLPRITRNIYT